jgi:hypothetical protein
MLSVWIPATKMYLIVGWVADIHQVIHSDVCHVLLLLQLSIIRRTCIRWGVLISCPYDRLWGFLPRRVFQDSPDFPLEGVGAL